MKIPTACSAWLVSILSIASFPLPVLAQTTAAAPVPPTAFANVDLPSWLRIGIEHRGRLEVVSGAGFSPDRKDLYWLNRFRITAGFSMTPWLSARVR
jgi:hypothetical protein